MFNLRKLSGYFLVVFMLAGFNCLAIGEDVIPTDKNVDFYGYCKSLKQSDVVTVYDPDGVLCGKFVVETEGQYGVIHVYGDDVTTSDIDEGASSGDVLSFYVNDTVAIPLNEESVIWTSDGHSKQLDF